MQVEIEHSHGQGSRSMINVVQRLADVAHDSAEMIGRHARRIAGVCATAVSGLVDEVSGLVWDCRDVVRTGLQSDAEEFDLRLDLGSIDLEPQRGPDRVRHPEAH